MSTLVGTLSPERPRRRGRSIVKTVLIAAAVVTGLSAVAVPLYSDMWARAHTAKALADTRTLVRAIALYEDHTGRLPAALKDLTRVTINSWEDSAGPFLAVLPAPPAGATAYRYVVRPDGRSYTISVTVDGQVIEVDRNGVRQANAAPAAAR